MTSLLQRAADAAVAEPHRISAIMALDAAKTRPRFANYIALKSTLSVAEAKTMLELAGHEAPSIEARSRASSSLGHQPSSGPRPRADIVADMRRRLGQ